MSRKKLPEKKNLERFILKKYTSNHAKNKYQNKKIVQRETNKTT